MRARRYLVLVVLLVVVVGGAVWLLREAAPPAGASRVERIWIADCAPCHGRDGRGSWRAVLFLVKPNDLTDTRQMQALTDDYLFEIIKKGGSPIGKPGMPGYEGQLSDEEIRALVAYVRSLGRRAGGG
jgi:mono/diheme cytochrome c family protein